VRNSSRAAPPGSAVKLGSTASTGAFAAVCCDPAGAAAQSASASAKNLEDDIVSSNFER
jgi:hypothetical protein